MAQDGLQFSSLVTATSTGVATSYGFRARSFLLINDTTSQSGFVDVTGGSSVLATSSAGYRLGPLQVLGPFVSAHPNAFWSGFSAKTSDGTVTIRPLALG